MAGYVLVRSNWTSINSKSLDLVCDVGFEENNQSTSMDKQEENKNDDNLRKPASSDEDLTNVILKSNDTEKREDPVIILSVLQPDEYHISSIQVLANARHIEFYHREYIGSCQGSRITELDNEPIYESIFEFTQPHEEINLKCLKLADRTELVVYCLQITLNKIKANSSSAPVMNLPFDLNRVRSMIDETNLSSNARQFMNDLQHIQDKRTKQSSSQPFNLGQMMLMMKDMTTSSSNTKKSSPTSLMPIVNEMKSALNEDVKSASSNQDDTKLNALENRLQTYIDERFLQLQKHIDNRLDRLEEKLTELNQKS